MRYHKNLFNKVFRPYHSTYHSFSKIDRFNTQKYDRLIKEKKEFLKRVMNSKKKVLDPPYKSSSPIFTFSKTPRFIYPQTVIF